MNYWPLEDGRAECGYVGLTNLGATCYLASCIQQLYMLPRARAAILSARVLIFKFKKLYDMYSYIFGCIVFRKKIRELS